jgi:hypothetical protein
MKGIVGAYAIEQARYKNARDRLDDVLEGITPLNHMIRDKEAELAELIKNNMDIVRERKLGSASDFKMEIQVNGFSGSLLNDRFRRIKVANQAKDLQDELEELSKLQVKYTNEMIYNSNSILLSGQNLTLIYSDSISMEARKKNVKEWNQNVRVVKDRYAEVNKINDSIQASVNLRKSIDGTKEIVGVMSRGRFGISSFNVTSPVKVEVTKDAYEAVSAF